MITANSLSDFVDRLGAATAADGAWARTCEFFADQGLPWVCYGYADVDKDAALSVPSLRSNVRNDFVNRWVEEGLCGDDPGVRHAVSSLQCKVDGSEFMTPEDSSKAVWEYYWDSREIGYCSVLNVPIRNNARSASGFLALGGAFTASDMRHYLGECQDRLALEAHHADRRLVELTDAAEAELSGLSPREIQCLQWLARGLRNDRISDTLGIARPTVKLHLQNARRKLRSSTREQAVAQAIRLGLIEP